VTWWIGRIEPSMWFEGPSWAALLPADVRVGVLSLGIGRIVTRPFVTSLQAELEALRAVGAGGVAIASPYPLAQTAKRVALLEEEGFQVLGHDSLDIERNREIAMLDPERVVRQAVEVAGRWPAAEVVYLPCGSLPVVGSSTASRPPPANRWSPTSRPRPAPACAGCPTPSPSPATAACSPPAASRPTRDRGCAGPGRSG
jgi:Arylmalonate decarboxylase